MYSYYDGSDVFRIEISAKAAWQLAQIPPPTQGKARNTIYMKEPIHMIIQVEHINYIYP